MNFHDKKRRRSMIFKALHNAQRGSEAPTGTRKRFAKNWQVFQQARGQRRSLGVK